MARKPSRRELKAQAYARALDVQVPKECDVCVAGGGASGLMAALAAAEEGARVVLLERDHEAGLTILATGNGRCNLSNERLVDALLDDASPLVRYRNARFARAVMGEEPESWIRDRFERLGLDMTSDNGRIYPASRVAASVRDVLLAALRREGVVVAAGRLVLSLKGRDDGRLQVSYLNHGSDQALDLTCRSLVLSSGGALTGGHDAQDGSPHDLRLSLSSIPPSPILCPLACADVPGELDGRRVNCRVSVLRDGEPIGAEQGEVMFRQYGLSGVVVFNLSRVVRAGDVLSLNLLPSYRADELQARLLALRDAGLTLQEAASGLLDPAVARVLAERSQNSWSSYAELAQQLEFSVLGTAEETHAQVTRGGIAVSELDPATLMARKAELRGLFACGEALDVDGPCGGYNLAWAWRSGDVAGRSASRWAKPSS